MSNVLNAIVHAGAQPHNFTLIDLFIDVCSIQTSPFRIGPDNNGLEHFDTHVNQA